MPDPFAASADSVTSPAEDAAAIVPHDTNPVLTTPKALFVGTGGHIVMRGVGGSADVTFRNVASGSVLGGVSSVEVFASVGPEASVPSAVLGTPRLSSLALAALKSIR